MSCSPPEFQPIYNIIPLLFLILLPVYYLIKGRLIEKRMDRDMKEIQAQRARKPTLDNSPEPLPPLHTPQVDAIAASVEVHYVQHKKNTAGMDLGSRLDAWDASHSDSSSSSDSSSCDSSSFSFDSGCD